MNRLRRLLLGHRALAAWIVALALLVKVVVPAGYMIGVSHGAAIFELCDGHAPMRAMSGMAHHTGNSGHAAKDMPCAFSSLTAPSLAAAEPALLAAAIALLFATVFRIEIVSRARDPAYLRPPLRGPPLPA